MPQPNLMDFLDWLEEQVVEIDSPEEFYEWYNSQVDQTEPQEDVPPTSTEPADANLADLLINKSLSKFLQEDRLPNDEESGALLVLARFSQHYN